MFSKSEGAELRKLFWTAFGRYMTRHISLRGDKIKWLNYKTGVKDIYFRLDADTRRARVSIELHHRDPGVRNLFWEQFQELDGLLHSQTQAEWTWEDLFVTETGQEIARIYVETEGVNVYDQESWGSAFAFFEQYLIPLDELWSDVWEIFLDLSE
ncbi:MAG: DUF4268 domain-containing protein [Bacteroidia bacterium]|nr:DUF4268 domain-containing protein [Bacteroidia bacterium]